MNPLRHLAFSPRLASFLVATAALALACGAPDGAPPAESDGPLLGAPVASGYTFSVGVCAGPLTGGATPDQGLCLQPRTRCTGTLVASNLVLTARHCVQPIEPGPSFCEGRFADRPLTEAPVRVTLDDSVKIGDPQWLEVKELLFPRTANSCDDDIALAILKAPIPAAQAQPVAMHVSRNVVTQRPSSLVLVGRGVVEHTMDLETFEETFEDGDLRRRILRDIPFRCATDQPIGCEVVDHSSPPTNRFRAPTTYFITGAGPASGDSGAAVFDQSQFDASTFERRPGVIGVQSAGTFGPDGKPNHGLVVRLSHHRTFLDEGMRRARQALP